MPPEVEGYAARARSTLKSPHVPDDFWLPDRIRQMTKRLRPPEFVKAMIADVMRNPRGDALVVARALFNELGRHPEGARAVRAGLTPEILGRAMAVPRKRK